MQRHMTAIVATVVVLLAAGYVTLDRDTVVWNRTLTISAPPAQEATRGTVEQYRDLMAGGDLAARLGAHVFAQAGDQYLIRVGVYQPDPPLFGLSIRLDPQLPLSAERLRLAVPGGDWPPLTYQRDLNGSLRLEVDGLREHTTTVEFVLDARGVDPRQLQDTLSVSVKADLRPRMALVAREGRADFEVPLAPCQDGCR